MRTFKQLQDAVLQWMADEGDAGKLRTLVKDGLNRTHQNLLNDDRYDFMLWPRNETLAIVANQKVYALHPRFSQPLYVYNPDTNTYLEEIPPKGLLESQADWHDGDTDEVDRFMLTGVSKVKAQPATPATVTVTSAGPASATQSLIITGVSSGVPVSETLSSGSSWTTLTSTTTFEVIEDITKVGTGWAQPLTITCGATTILTLPAAELGIQYRMLELVENPTSAQTILYRFYKEPRQLVNDNDVPDLPAQFDDILVYQTLLAMVGYTRASQDEQGLWQAQVRKLTDLLQQTYRASRTMGGRATYIRYIPRV
jgi:hypothetical protein